MSDSDNPFHISRGVKRKLFSEAKTPFAQRLEAARKAPKSADVDPIVKDTEANDAPASNLDENKESERLKIKVYEDDWRLDEHYSNLYRGNTDFAAIAAKDERLQPYLKGDRHLDFTDPKAFMQLTKSLLKVDFGLTLELPDDRLCPPIPNRHNYILWIKELIDSTSKSWSELYDPERNVEGLDIGTGASAIYPLLGCTQRPGWSFIATDIDVKSLSWARENVKANGLESRIRLLQRTPTDKLIPLDASEVACLDFVMTNPPFYSSESELQELAELKGQPPNSACTGAAHEMVCEGGEMGFFQRIFDESFQLKTRVQWYTMMLGKQSSVEAIAGLFKSRKIDNYALTRFVQGTKTRRWAVAWSFGERRPNGAASRGFEPSAGKRLFANPTEVVVASKLTNSKNAEQVKNMFWTQLEDVTDGLDLLSWNMDEERLRVVGFAEQNVWGRAYRRSAKRSAINEMDPPDLFKCGFGFAITVRTIDVKGPFGDDGQRRVEVVVRWLQGVYYSLFESFAEMVRNAMLKVV
ncbi:hypothetical protein G7054_g11077 [Neopestalotiopsis clavispora]|nr:hypothetical protein G7054_g11077 [Neopestalotiopsis clavispora]